VRCLCNDNEVGAFVPLLDANKMASLYHANHMKMKELLHRNDLGNS